MRQTWKGSYPDVSHPSLRSIDDFIDVVRRVERSHPESDALGVATRLMRSKYHDPSWDWLLPSSLGMDGVSIEDGLSRDEVDTLSGEFEVSSPHGPLDPTHIVAAIAAHFEVLSPGSRGVIPRLAQLLIGRLPPAITQRDIATWVGDVASAAAYWRAGYQIPGTSGELEKSDYVARYSPPADVLGDVDGIVVAANYLDDGSGGVSSESLSSALSRYYGDVIHGLSGFKTFCEIEDLKLADGGDSLSLTARDEIDRRVESCTTLFFRWRLPFILWLLARLRVDRRIVRRRRARRDDWLWFSRDFMASIESKLRHE